MRGCVADVGTHMHRDVGLGRRLNGSDRLMARFIWKCILILVSDMMICGDHCNG